MNDDCKLKAFELEDGEIINVGICGEGPPVILIHGWTSGPHIWTPFIETLSQDYQVIVWHARGHGQQELRLKDPLTIQHLAEDLMYLINKLELSQPTLIGHSMGAMLSLEYFSRFGTKNINGFVMIDQSPCCMNRKDWHHGIYGNFTEAMNHEHIKNMQHDFPEGVLRFSAEGLNTKITESYKNKDLWLQELKKYLGSLNKNAMIDLWKDFSTKDWRDVLPKLNIPIGIIFGSQSQFYTLDTMTYIEDHIELSQSIIIDEANHSPQLTHPEEFQYALLEMLKFTQENQ